MGKIKNVAAIVPSAGAGKRFRSAKPKVFFRFAGKPLIAHTLGRLLASYPFRRVIVAAHPANLDATKKLLGRHGFGGVEVVPGGRTRALSVLNALRRAAVDCEWALVHDAARPFVTRGLVRSTLKAAAGTGAAICALPVSSTVKKCDISGRYALCTVDRSRLYLAQTPQVFKTKLLLGRYRALGNKAATATDDAALFQGSGVRVRITAGLARNIKVTTREDVPLFHFYRRRTGC